MNRLFSKQHIAVQAVVLLAASLLSTAGVSAANQTKSMVRSAAAPSHVVSSRLHAKQANVDAVTEATSTIIKATKNDLDLRLIGPTSQIVASR